MPRKSRSFQMSVHPTQVRGNALLVREEEERERRKRSLSTQRWWTFRPSGALGSQEEMSVVALVVLKDLRKGGRSSAFSLGSGDVFNAPRCSLSEALLFCPFLSHLFSFLFQNTNRNSGKLDRSSGSPAVFPRSDWIFHWPDRGRMFWNCVESNLWVFSSSEYWGLECKAAITCFLFGSRFSS